ncbi:Predicted PurR-regulated permease PerM [Filomicrobium insigne]|uniref:Predicted PurR-regulated permease PerM n=1 Tax=Filomicrobium insigne TaxID=418854 RepID=A0A1H0MQ94_9HYPH|nr:AI-2E family transporter [Filomicrobium insigne]SDO82547.1 Predicted PurR-regulated permease PerM [Filomicrobium insigne]
MRVEQQALFWLIAAVVLVLLIGLLQEILLPFVLGILFAYGLNPVADALERIGLPRVVSCLAIVALLVIAIVLVIVFVGPVLVEHVTQFANALPTELQRLQDLLQTWAQEKLGTHSPAALQAFNSVLTSLSENWEGVASWVAQSLWTQGRALFNVLSLVLITPLVVFYLLVDWKRMLGEVDRWLPRGHAAPLRQMARDINGAVSAFIRGQGTVCLILGCFYALSLWAVGLHYGALIGFATGVLAFVPVLGWAIGTLIGMTLAVLQFWPDTLPVMLVLGVFLAGQALDAGILSPNIVGSKIGLHPVWLIFALFAFSYLFGIVGALVAVPLAAAVGVIVRYGLKAYLASSVYTGEAPAAPGDPPV